MFLLHLTISLIVTYVITSLIEYMVHKHPMHSPRLAKLFKSHSLEEAYKNHASLHHNKYYSTFTHENDAEGRKIGIPVGVPNTIIVLGPIIFLFYFIDPLTSFTLLLLAIAHNIAWTAMHQAMHDKESAAWWTKTSYFLYLKRYHFLHHRQQGKNFNAMLPLWDWILGTHATARKSDELEMATLWRVRQPKSERKQNG
jgi:hypothetical protein